MADREYKLELTAEGIKATRQAVEKVSSEVKKIPKSVESAMKKVEASIKSGNSSAGDPSRASSVSNALRIANEDMEKSSKSFEKAMEKGASSASFIEKRFTSFSKLTNTLKEAEASIAKMDKADVASGARELSQELNRAYSSLKVMASEIDQVSAELWESSDAQKQVARHSDRIQKIQQRINSLLGNSNSLTVDKQAILNKVAADLQKHTAELQEVNAELNEETPGLKKKVRQVETLGKSARQAKAEMAGFNKEAEKEEKRRPNRGGPKSRQTHEKGLSGQRGSGGRNESSTLALAKEGNRGVIAAYATIAANLFAITAAYQRLSDAAKAEQLTEGVNQLGYASGQTFSVITKGLREVTDYAISTVDAMRSVALATSAGFNQDEIEALGRVAKGASIALGRDMSDAMDRLSRGAIKLEPEILDELGIMVRLDDAVENYADQIGKAKSELTQFERRQAFMNEIIEQGNQKFGDIADNVDVSAYDKLTASIRDAGTETTKVLNSAFLPLVSLVADNPMLLAGPFIGVIALISGKLLPTLDSAKEKMEEIKESYSKRNTFLKESYDESVDNQINIKKRTNAYSSKISSTNSRLNDRLFDLGEKDILQSKAQLKDTYELLELEKMRVRLSERSYQAKVSELNAIDVLQGDVKKLIALENRRLNTQLESMETVNQETLRNANEGVIRDYEKAVVGGGFFTFVTEGQKSINSSIKNSLNYYARQTDALDQMTKSGIGFSRVEMVFKKTATAATATASAIMNIGRVGSVVIQRLLPMLAIATAAFSIAKSVYDAVTQNDDVKRLKAAKEDLDSVLESLPDKLDEITKAQSQAYSTAENLSDQYIIMSNIVTEIAEAMEKVNNIQSQIDLKKYKEGKGDFMDSYLGYLGRGGVYDSSASRESAKAMAQLQEDFFLTKKITSQMKEFEKDFVNFPQELKDIFWEAKEAYGGFEAETSNSSKNQAIFNRILGRAQERIGTLSKSLPELAESYRQAEKAARDYTKSTEIKTSVDGLVDSFKQLENIVNDVAEANINKKMQILGSSVAESTPAVQRLLNLTPTEKSTVIQLKELQDEIDNTWNPFKKKSIQEAIDSLQTLLGVSVQSRGGVTGGLADLELQQSLEASTALENARTKAVASIAKAADNESSLSTVLQSNLAIKENELKLIEQKRILAEKIADPEKKSLEISNLKIEKETVLAEIQEMQMVGKKELLSTEREILSVELDRIKTFNKIKDLETEAASIRRKSALVSMGGSSFTTFEENLINNLVKLSQKKLELEEVQAELAVEAKDNEIKRLDIAQKLNEAKLKTGPGAAELVDLYSKQLKLLEDQYTEKYAQLDVMKAELELAQAEVTSRSILLELDEQRVSLFTQQLSAQQAINSSILDGENLRAKLERAKTTGIADLTPDQEINARIKALDLDIQAAETRSKVVNLESNLKRTTIDLERGLLDYRIGVVKAELELARQQGRVKDPGAVSDILNEYSDSSKAILDLQEDAIELEKRLASLGVENAKLAKEIEIALGSASDRFFSSMNKNLDVLGQKLSSSFIPFIGSTYNENRDRFIDEVGREPNKDEESTLKKRSALETNLKATMEANRTLIASLESAYDTFFTEIANGADNMAESFKKMTISVLADLAKIYTKAFIINSLTGMTGLFGGTSSPAVTSSPSATVPFANGGIRQGGFGLTPGVYPARSPIAVFGEGNKNEAAVPLPNGKEIPVDLRGSGGVSQSNNVNVNINIDGKGGASSSVSGDNMDKLGEMLSAAVIKELLEQQRPGGILSKHGA